MKLPRIRSLCLLAIGTLCMPTTVFGYTDPGTGTLIWQLTLGGLTGALFYLRRLKNWYRRRRGKADS